MNKQAICWLLCTALGFLALMSGMLLSPVNHYLTALLLVTVAIALYFAIVFLVAERNWLDIRAVFAGVWIATIGLASLRLTDYQKQWESLTWIIVAIAYAAFQIGAGLGVAKGQRWYPVLHARVNALRFGKFSFKMQHNRLFWVCIIATGLGLAAFLINVAIKGFIPCFSSSVTAYLDFYTKFHIFAVASTAIAGLCYYCIVKEKLSIPKKIILGLCIFYTVILFPVLVVSRGTFITAAVSLMVSVFYLHKKKLIALILCIITILSVYMMTSNLRGYTDAQLNEFFEPSDIIISRPNDSSEPSSTDPSSGDETGDVGTQTSFTLPPKVAFLYSYLTVSHDNFNEAVLHTEHLTYGVRQFAPFNVIFRINKIDSIIENAEYHQVRPHLTTTNVIGDFYYDFGAVGVGVLMLIWSFVFGVMQGFAEKGNGPFALVVLGNTMVPVALSFFSTWLSIFSHWMLWGVVIFFALGACLCIEKKQK